MMKEPHQRPLSFQANTFSRFAKKHGIEVQSQPYDPYGLVSNESLRESKHFTVVLAVGERRYSFALEFLQYRNELPSVEDVLENVANDVAVVERFEEAPNEFAMLIERPLAEASQIIEQAGNVAGPFRMIIGQAAYDEFVRITEIRR